MNNINLLAIDITKINFQLHGVDDKGNVLFRKKLTRNKLVEFIANLPVCTIAMEACGGANFWARKFTNKWRENYEFNSHPPKPNIL